MTNTAVAARPATVHTFRRDSDSTPAVIGRRLTPAQRRHLEVLAQTAPGNLTATVFALPRVTWTCLRRDGYIVWDDATAEYALTDLARAVVAPPA